MAGRFSKVAWTVLAALALAACVPGLGAGKKPAAPNPVTGGAIEVTALDEAAPAPAAGNKATAETAALTAPADMPKPQPRPAGIDPVPAPAAGAEAVPAPVPAVVVPEVEKTPMQIACEKKKGVWTRTEEGAHACVTYTGDGGKRCTKATQCESACLARSGTCAPYQPLFGCNEILDDMGRRMTLCLD